MPRGGGRRGTGRAWRGAAAAAARPPRDERAMEVVELISDDDHRVRCEISFRLTLFLDGSKEYYNLAILFTDEPKSATQAEGCAADVSEVPPCQSPKEVSAKNLGRLRKRTAAAGGAATSELHEDEVQAAEVMPSNGEDGQLLHPCRRSKRLQRERTEKQELSSRDSQPDVFVNSKDAKGELLAVFYLKISKRLRHRMGTSKDAYNSDSDSDTVDNHRKAIPCRRMSKRLQEKQKADHVSDERCTEASPCMLSTSKSSGSDDELLRSTVKPCKRTSSGPICSICKVPLDWLLVVERQRARSYISKNTLPKEAYSEDQRKPEWLEVDRAIACRRKFGRDGLCDVLASFHNNEDFEGYEFLVKWKGLDYCDVTWESYCTEGVASAVSMLVQRHKNTLQSPMNSDVMVPENVLYAYQLQGLQWILDNFKSRRSVILADEMGLGKTVQVVCFLNRIIKGSLTTSPALVIVPKSILLQWEKEFDRWAHDVSIVVYQGDKDSRKCIQAHELYSSKGKTLFDALVTSYEIVQLDKAVLKKIKWSTIVIDEAHRLKTLDCNLASCLKKYSSDFRLLLTGRPFQNNVLELFSLLHYIDPNEFSDPNDDPLFSPIESERGLTIDEKIARIPEILKPRMLRRLKADVLKDSMPTKKWVEVPCTLTDSQRDLYINILEKNYSELNSAIQDVAPKIEREREPCIDLLPDEKMLDILEDFLSFLGYTYARIDGQTALSERQESIKEHNNVESETFIFLMSTCAGGIGIDLPGADRVIIYDPDFNSFMDLQAQSRAHRIGQTRPVVVYQLITKCSVEAKILQKSKQKLAIENILMNSSKKPPSADELKSILLHGAKIIQDKKEIKAVSIHYDDEAIENLLKLDPSSDEMCTKEGNGYLGGIESFPHGAEDVVPPSPKVEDLKVFKPATPKVDLGRGRRQRNAVKYFEETDNEDSDDMYAPEASSESSSSSSDDETDEEIPEVARARTEVDMKAETVSVVKPEVAPVPGSPLTSSESESGSSSSDDEMEEVKPIVAGVKPQASGSSSSESDSGSSSSESGSSSSELDSGSSS
ncbi:unnamed protein product [Triticum turgidum subsp. durum]|uniref:CHD3-type chromatin-remodeling factor PICKLE n=1 Tax=Triticum turgidum subsp. durum TaxID=4567 RepID=A0A9R1S7I6_TRITD|nr:unnamed protein product [Triticum turgidum subsp. durum]